MSPSRDWAKVAADFVPLGFPWPAVAETTIRKIRVQDLVSFYEGRGWGDGVRPISRPRAQAQARNPSADPEDVALLVAFEGERCVGYLGLIPGLAQVGDRTAKVYWLSAWYVDPSARASSAGALLLLAALRLGYDLFACGMSPDSLAAFRAMRFSEMAPLRLHRLILDHRIQQLTAPLRALRRAIRMARGDTKGIQKLVDSTRSQLKGLKEPMWRELIRRVGNASETRFTRVDRFGAVVEPSETSSFSFLRGQDAANWTLAWPWVPSEETGRDEDYYFLARRDHFEHLGFLATDSDGVPCGYATILLTREHGVTTLRLLDAVFKTPERRRAAAALLVDEGRRFNADVLEFSREFGEVFADLPTARIEEIRLPCLYRLGGSASPFHGTIEYFEPHLTDGDLPHA
jgi:hypothetical protein